MSKNVSDFIIQLLGKQSLLTSKEIANALHEEYKVKVNKETVNKLLYGSLQGRVVRDKDENGYPVWRIKTKAFEAAKGLEVLFYKELIRDGICTYENSYLDYSIVNSRNGKTYFLDIAIIDDDRKFNIEIDGFEHIRADARLSIQRQIFNIKSGEIEIDWMDNKTSFTDFGLIDNKGVFKWLQKNREWCIRYHEELLKPHDITRNIWLIENGWRVLRFWNFEIKDEVKKCREIVREWVYSS